MEWAGGLPRFNKIYVPDYDSNKIDVNVLQKGFKQQLIKGDLFELYQFLTCDRDDMSEISFECSECGEVWPVEVCSNFGVVFMFGDLQERHRCSIGF